MDSRCCGLVLICSREKVPLKGISVDVQVKGFVADVSATLKYKNLEEKPIEAVFVFSMDNDSAVYSFEATVEGQTIVADLQEEKQAHIHYDHYMSQGQQAFLLEEDENSRDVFKCYVGNLLPGQEAEVTLCYVQELPVEADGAVRFVLPAILNPRYTPEGEALNVTATHPRVPVGQIPYTLSLDAHFQSAFGISKIESNCDLTPLDYTDTDKTSAEVSLSEGHKFEQDVELLAYYADANKPSATMELGDSGAKEGSFMAHHVVMLNFNPSFPEAEEQCTCGEFIFLMDRSGSMQEQMNSKPNSPQRIQSAKDTLILLLKSLPLGSYFNVFSFGSGFQSFFPKSVEYTQKSMEKAWRKVKEMEANFGGTEILEPLNHIYKTRSRPGHPRQLFVFTDGEVGNTRSVIEVVQKNAKNHRCFTFGIGEGASTALLKGMARSGNGTADFITSNDRMQPKVLRALKHAIQPIVEDVALKWSLPPDLDSDLLSVIPHAIFQGHRCILYAQVKGKVDFPATGSVSLEYRYKDEVFQNVLPLSFDAGKAERPTIHRLAAKTLISELEDRDFSDSEETKKRILETSLQSGVISSLTAFLAVNKDTTQLVDCDPLRWDIPSTVSYCYEAIDCCLFVDNMDDFPPCQVAPPPPPIPPRRSRFSRLVASIRRQCSLKKDSANADCDTGSPEALESSFLRLISLQKADGSWSLSSGFSVILGIAECDLKRKKPQQGVDNSVWATLLAVIRLHASYSGQRDEWELLERKALSWLKHKAGTSLGELVKAGNELLASSVNLKVFGL